LFLIDTIFTDNAAGGAGAGRRKEETVDVSVLAQADNGGGDYFCGEICCY